MEFMLLFLDRKDASAGASGEPSARREPRMTREPSGIGMPELKAFAEELARQGTLRRAAPLAPEADGVRIRVRDGEAAVSDGPFAEWPEAVGGVWIVEAASRDEAIAIARRAFELGQPPAARRDAVVEVHALQFRQVAAAPPRDGVAYLLAFRREPGLSDCSGSKLQEMIDFGHRLEKEGTFFETAPLTSEPLPARIERRGGKTRTLDGPFAEAKEAVGGYSLIRVASHAEALAIATRYPHARWGPVELREVIAPG